jgi:YVTN family beta-propeller protein
VGASGAGGVWIVDTQAEKVLFSESFGGLNFGHMQFSADGRDVFFPSMFYGNNPTTPGNIRRGWVLGNRLARIGADKPERRNALTLDVRRRAAADPHGVALTGDGRWIAITAAGTHELLALRRDDLPLVGIGGTELMDGLLQDDGDRFFRIPLGGRPLGMAVAADHKTVYVANSLQNSVQVVDLGERRLARTISLGQTPELTAARRGEAIFYDGHRSLEGWYSCQSCHYDGGSNSETIDTLNDGSTYTYKTVPALFHVSETGPWTWHGWQNNLQEAMKKSLTETMRGPDPTKRDVEDLIAFLKTLRPPPNSHRGTELSESAARGKTVFHSARGGCADCHNGPLFTDGQNHDVGLGRASDRYKGFNTPTLVGVHRRIRLLHDGRVRSLADLLTGPHAPEKVAGEKLTDAERTDLIEYLKSL